MHRETHEQLERIVDARKACHETRSANAVDLSAAISSAAGQAQRACRMLEEKTTLLVHSSM